MSGSGMPAYFSRSIPFSKAMARSSSAECAARNFFEGIRQVFALAEPAEEMSDAVGGVFETVLRAADPCCPVQDFVGSFAEQGGFRGETCVQLPGKLLAEALVETVLLFLLEKVLDARERMQPVFEQFEDARLSAAVAVMVENCSSRSSGFREGALLWEADGAEEETL